MQFSFEKLEVYNNTIEFADKIYETTKSFPKNEIFGITNKLRWAFISISSYVAESSNRGKKGIHSLRQYCAWFFI